jgi:hypothetical protein
MSKAIKEFSSVFLAKDIEEAHNKRKTAWDTIIVLMETAKEI